MSLTAYSRLLGDTVAEVREANNGALPTLVPLGSDTMAIVSPEALANGDHQVYLITQREAPYLRTGQVGLDLSRLALFIDAIVLPFSSFSVMVGEGAFPYHYGANATGGVWKAPARSALSSDQRDMSDMPFNFSRAREVRAFPPVSDSKDGNSSSREEWHSAFLCPERGTAWMITRAQNRLEPGWRAWIPTGNLPLRWSN